MVGMSWGPENLNTCFGCWHYWVCTCINQIGSW